MSRDPMEYMCKHYTAMCDHDHCRVGVRYNFPPLKPLQYPCFGKNVDRCDQRQGYTKEDIEAENKMMAEILDMIGAGKSPCCQAPIDESRVIRGGPYDGHGPRLCSKCHKWVFSV